MERGSRRRWKRRTCAVAAWTVWTAAGTTGWAQFTNPQVPGSQIPSRQQGVSGNGAVPGGVVGGQPLLNSPSGGLRPFGDAEPIGPGVPANPDTTAPPANPLELPPQQRIIDVRIIGNETVDSDKVQSYIRHTRKDRYFDSELIQQDVLSLKTRGMFREVLVSKQETAHGVIVTFEVFERPIIRYIEFIGDRGLTSKSLMKETGLKVGDAMNAYAVEEARRKLEELYRRKGYPKVQVTIAEGNRLQEDRGVVFLISEGPLQRIWSVSFMGNDGSVISDGRLKTQIESKPGFLKLFGGKLDHDKINGDIEKLTAYYRGLGFFRARVGRQIEYDDEQKWVTLKFVIDEGPRYVVRNVSVVGNQKFTTPELEQLLQLRTGDYFNLDRMNADVNAIRDTYGGKGYIFADIKSDPRFLEDPGQIDLVYNVQEGQQFRVGRINVKIAGEFPHTKERVILDRLSIRPGQIVDIREIRNSERRLKASQLFIVNPSEGEPPRIVILPPELKDTDKILAENGGGTVTRGQSPDDGIPIWDLEIHLPECFRLW